MEQVEGHAVIRVIHVNARHKSNAKTAGWCSNFFHIGPMWRHSGKQVSGFTAVEGIQRESRVPQGFRDEQFLTKPSDEGTT